MINTNLKSIGKLIGTGIAAKINGIVKKVKIVAVEYMVSVKSGAKDICYDRHLTKVIVTDGGYSRFELKPEQCFRNKRECAMNDFYDSIQKVMDDYSNIHFFGDKKKDAFVCAEKKRKEIIEEFRKKKFFNIPEI